MFDLLLYLFPMLYLPLFYSEKSSSSPRHCLRTTGGSYVPVPVISNCMNLKEPSSTNNTAHVFTTHSDIIIFSEMIATLSDHL